MKTDFERQIYDDVKRLFADGTVQTCVAQPSFSGGLPQTVDPAVRLVHTITGLEVTCSDFPSQTENYIAAAIQLRIACDRSTT